MRKYLNPNYYTIYGWENRKSLENVISIMIGLIEEDEIPPVRLNTFNGREDFMLKHTTLGERADGGHHRLIAASLLNRQIMVDIRQFPNCLENHFGINEVQRIKIQDIKLKPNPEHYLRDTKKRELPQEKIFFRKYPRIIESLERRNYYLTKESYQEMLNHIIKEDY